MTKHHKKAAKESRDGSARYVVHVPDEGAQVFDQEQMKRYGDFVFVEGVYISGALVAAGAAA